MSIWKYFCEYRKPAHLKTKNTKKSQTLKSECSDVDEGRYFSQWSCVTQTDSSRENMIFKKHFSFLARHQCISVTRSSQKEGKSSRKLRFLRISCKRKLLEHVLKIKISKRWKVSAQRSGAVTISVEKVVSGRLNSVAKLCFTKLNISFSGMVSVSSWQEFTKISIF